MTILSTSGWSDYELLDSGNGQRLERFGKYILVRPDPQIIWQRQLPQSRWDQADAVFTRTSEDKGLWKKKNTIPDKWLISWNGLSFWVKLTPFKHTGVFPEQVSQWEWINSAISHQLSAVSNQTTEKSLTVNRVARRHSFERRGELRTVNQLNIL